MKLLYYIPIFFLWNLASASGEPHCSRFHYEEKLLEKMVRMEIRMEEIERNLETATGKNRLLETDVKDLKVRNNDKVTFFAKAKSNQLSMNKHQTLIFEDVVTNIGSTYDRTCGKFVAPKSGTYVFFSTVLGRNNAMIFLYLAVNDRRIVNFCAHGLSDGHDSTSVTVPLQLDTGDIVTIKNNKDGGNIHGNEYSSFGGFLLY
ncbi:complement C1q-like protein 4 [Mercenaria mercenaria]|uniref:complement C1q-like protein 4 n=1 Tax=Mercenaria mercenaria TaxID=6596 RepID=UPI00234E9495|nr:complement C1q-like protein 4 [Mercenaria mercenaria]